MVELRYESIIEGNTSDSYMPGPWSWIGGLTSARLNTGKQPETGIAMIRAVFRRVGISLEPEDIEDDYFCWRLKRGSAHLLVMFYRDHNHVDGCWVVQVSAVLVRLPEDCLLQIFQYCLSLNMELVECHFALHHEADIVLTSKRRAAGLDQIAFQLMLNTVAEQADRIDDELASRFGVKMWGQKQ